MVWGQGATACLQQIQTANAQTFVYPLEPWTLPTSGGFPTCFPRVKQVRPATSEERSNGSPRLVGRVFEAPGRSCGRRGKGQQDKSDT